MGIDPSDFRKMQERVAQSGHKIEPRESELHKFIREFCNGKWPRWKYLQARSDKRSTIAIGAMDFTIFMPECRVLLIECKTRTGKLSREQQSWHKEMEMLGQKVYVVRDIASFKQAIQDETCRLYDLDWDKEEAK